MVNIITAPSQGGVGIPRRDYVDNYFAKKPTGTFNSDRVVAVSQDGTPASYAIYNPDVSTNNNSIPIYKNTNSIGDFDPGVSIAVGTPHTQFAAANKDYVDSTIRATFRLSGSTLYINTP